jgi:hypothetical protein
MMKCLGICSVGVADVDAHELQVDVVAQTNEHLQGGMTSHAHAMTCFHILYHT